MNNFQKKIGNPDVTTYDECLKIFEFAEMTSDDIFYDLGCGYGTACIAAAEKYHVKKNVGIEARFENFLEATNRILDKGVEKNIEIDNEFLENIDFSDATIIYYSIKPNLNHILYLTKMIQDNCRIITPKIPLPSIKPKKNIVIDNSNFFLTEGSLDKSKTKNIEEWMDSIPDNIINKIKLDKNEIKWLEDLLNEIYLD